MSGLTIESKLTQTVQLNADPRFDVQDNNTIITINNVANTSKIETLVPNGSSLDNFQFQRQFNDRTFIGTGVTFRMEIPLKFTVPVAIPGVTADNFITTLFKDYSHLCLRSGGLLNIIESYSLQLNDMTYTVDNVQRLHQAIFKYYDDEDVNSWMEASQCDRYQNYESYQADARHNLLKVIAPGSTTDKVAIPVKVGQNEENIFLGGYKNGYNSRTPLMTFVSASADNLSFAVKMTLETYLPFSLLGLPGSDLSTYGVTNYIVNVRITKNFAGGELFSLAQRQIGAGPAYTYGFDYSSIDIDTSALPSSGRAKLLVPTWTANEYITNDMKDPATGITKPYAFAFNRVKISQPFEMVLNQGESNTFNLPQIPLNIIPRAIYVYAMRKKDTSNGSISVANTPSTFARLDNLRVTFDQQSTDFPNDAMGLYMVAKSNDLHMDRMSALYTSGFPVKLEVQRDLSTSSSLYTGLAKQTSIELSGTIRDLRSTYTGSGAISAIYEVIVAYAYDVYCEQMNGSFDVKDALVFDSSKLGNRDYHISLYGNRMRRVNQIGGFWGTLWRGLKSGLGAASTFFKKNPGILNAIGSAIDPSLGTVGTTIGTYLPGAGFSSNISGGGSVRTLGAGNVGKTTFRNNTSTPFTKPNF